MMESEAVQIIHTPIPTRLLQEAQMLVKDGWFADLDELLVQTLRRFLESHRAELVDQFVREDVAWGLHGSGNKLVMLRSSEASHSSEVTGIIGILRSEDSAQNDI